MAVEKKLQMRGLYTYRDTYSDIPEGALLEAKNINIDLQNLATPRKGYEDQNVTSVFGSGVDSMGEYQGQIILHGGTKLARGTVGSSSISPINAYTGTYAQYDSNIVRFASQNQNLYFNTSDGIQKLDSVTGTPRDAGAPKGKYLTLSLITATGTGIIANNDERSYRLVWGYKDTNGNTVLGAPSERGVIQNTAGSSRDVRLRSNLPTGVSSVEWFYQAYRTKQATIANGSGDEMFLVYESQLTSTDISNGYIQFDDITDDSLAGASLYTNDTQEGADNANTQPPACVDLVSYQNHMFYANTRLKSFLSLTLIGTLTAGDTITIDSGTPKVLTGVSGAPSTDQFQVVTAGTVAQQIDGTARSIVQAIDQYVTNVSAFYLSSANDLPGQMLLEAGDFSIDFSTISSVGTKFSPDLTSAVDSETESKSNRVYFSKLQEPEAVPLINFFDIGSSDDAIVALASLRDKVVVIKEKSIHRITGTDANSFATQLIDDTVRVSEIKTVQNLSNRVFALSNQGIISISDSVQILSRRVNDLVQSTFTDCHAVTKEKDGQYVLTCTLSDGSYYSVAYNTFNTLYTTWEKPLKTQFGYSFDDQLIFSTPSLDGVYQLLIERNSGGVLDYSDISEDYTVTDIDGGTFTFSDVSGLEVGTFISESGGDGEATVASIDVDNDTCECAIIEEPTASSGTWSAYGLIDTSIKFWPYLGAGIDYFTMFNELALIFSTQISGSVVTTFSSDLSSTDQTVTFSDVQDTSGWGLFAWGEIPWGEDEDLTKTFVKRILVPRLVSKAHELDVKIEISTSNQLWQFSGISLKYRNVNFTPQTK